MKFLKTIVFIFWFVSNDALLAQEQVYFRHDFGVAEGTASLPLNFEDDATQLWHSPLPAGHSTPCVCGDAIYLTTFQVEQQELATVALDRATGVVRWRQVVPTKSFEPVHATGSTATSSPACNGKQVFVFFGSYGMLCYDLDGRLRWERKFGPFQDEFGAASSPILVDDKVILNEDHDIDSSLIALNQKDGEEVWNVERREATRSYSTPFVLERDGKKQVLIAGSLQLAAYDPATGEKLWWYNGISRIVDSTPVIHKGTIYVAYNPRTRSVNGVKDLSDFGAKLPFTYPVKPFPGMSISGLGAGVAGNTDSIDQSNYRLNAKMSWVIGRHNIRFGGETQRDRNPIYANGSNSNQYNFSGMFSLNGPRQNGVQYPSPGNFGSQSIGYSFADFLLGQVENFALTQVWNNTVSYHTHNLFVQDEWKVRPRLSLSLGLRYELYGDAHEDNDMLGGIFYRGHQSDLYPKAPFGLGFVGDKGVPRGLIPQDKNNFSPRLGVAYDLTGKGTTVIRAGIGIYYSAPSLGVLRQNAGGAWKVDLTGGNASLSDPVGTARFFPWDQSFRYGPQNPPRDPAGTYSPNDYPWLNNLATVPVNGVTRQIYNSSIIGFDQGLVTPYSLQWNIALERQVAEGIVVSAGYVGNRAVRLTDWQQINPAAWRDGANTSAQSIRDRRLDTNYSSLNSFQSRMRSSFDSLQLTAHFRRVHGFTSEMNYVFAKQITPWSDRNGDVIFNTAGGVAYPNRIDLDKAENLNHHAFKWFGTYDLPFAKGSRSFLGRAIGGWVLAGAWQVRSGSPLNVTWGYDANADNEGADRPSLVAPIRYTSGSKDQLSLRYLDASSFGSPCGSPAVVNSNCNVLGNLGRNAIWGVGAWSIDTSLIKSFRVSERTSAQFRWEASNLTNSNFLGAPSLGLGQGTNPDFGRIFQRSHSPRTMQLGLKFSF